MKTKFTKGEWEAVIYSGEHKVEVWSGDDQIYANGSVTNKEMDFANAHLIATAPDMYKELLWLKDVIAKHKGYGMQLHMALYNHNSKIDLLLTKARGE